MPNKPVDFLDFCREWTIFDQGGEEWPSLFDDKSRFVIVRRQGGFRFIPVSGIHQSMASKDLVTEPNGKFGQYHDGDRLEGALTASFIAFARPVYFTLNATTDSFVISLTDGDAPLAVARSHGGPHGNG